MLHELCAGNEVSVISILIFKVTGDKGERMVSKVDSELLSSVR